MSTASSSPDGAPAMPSPRVRGLIRAALRGGIAILSVLVVLGVLAFVPIQIPSVVSTYAQINSARKWILTKGRDGQLIATTFNYATGLSEGYGISNFDRGSSVYFSVVPSLAPGQFVSCGDTLGVVYSSDIQERLIALKGQLSTARSLLAVDSSGEKAAIVHEAEQKLNYAKRRKEEQDRILARSAGLYRDHLISQAEYELAENASNMLGDQIDLAVAALDAAQTGEKPAQLQFVNANIAALETEIAALQRRAATYTLTAPISGTLARSFSPETLLSIGDTTKYVALVPLKWADYMRVAKTPHARVTLPGPWGVVHGSIVGLNRELLPLHGEKVLIATVVVDRPPSEIFPGMLTRCRIECEPLTPRGYLRQFALSMPALGPLGNR